MPREYREHQGAAPRIIITTERYHTLLKEEQRISDYLLDERVGYVRAARHDTPVPVIVCRVLNVFADLVVKRLKEICKNKPVEVLTIETNRVVDDELTLAYYRSKFEQSHA